MKKLFIKIKHPLTLALLIFMVSFGLSLFLVYSRYQIDKDRDNDLMITEINHSKDRLNQTFSLSLSAARSLAFLIEELDDINTFDSLASQICNSNKSLDGLVLTKGNDITHIYPHTLNEKEIGRNIKRITSKLEYKNNAVIFHDSFILGQDNTSEAEKFLLGGHTVFSNNERDGYAIVIVKISTIIKSIGIDTSEFQFQLNKMTDDPKIEVNVYPENPTFETNKAAFITLGERGWKLYFKANPAKIPINIIILLFFSVLLSYLFGLQTYVVMSRRHKLKQMVDAKSLELSLSQHKYKSTIDRITDGFASLDTNWHFTYLNKAAADLLHRLPEDLIGKDFQLEFPNSVGKEFYQACERAMKEQKYMFHLEHLKTADFYIENHIYPSPEGLSIFLKDITAQKRHDIQEELNVNRFKRLVQNNDGIISVADKNLKLIFKSESSALITGWTGDDCNDITLLDHFLEEDKPEVLKIFQQVLENPGKPIPVTMRFKHKEGHLIWLSGSCTNLFDDPYVKGIVLNFKDISNKKITEAKLKRANQLYNFTSLINQSIVKAKSEDDLFNEVCRISVETGEFMFGWIGVIGKTSKVIFPKNSECEKCGYLDDLLISVDETIPEGMGPIGNAIRNGEYFVCNDIANADHLKPCATKGNKCGFAASILLPITKNNAIYGVFALYSEKVDYFDDEEIKLLLNATQDINFGIDVMMNEAHRQEVIEKIKSNERRFEALIENSSDGLSVLKEDGSIIYRSHSGQRMLGYVSEIMDEKLRPDLVHPDDRDAFILSFMKCISDPLRVSTIEYRHKMPDGTYKWMECRYYNLLKEPAVNAIVMNYHDIIERKVKEQEHIRIMNDLIQRTQNLEQFAYIVSHNLRAPVANILGISKVLKDEISTSEKAEIEQFIFSAVENLDDIVKDLNKILHVRFEITDNKELVHFSELVQGIQLGLQHDLDKDNIQIITNFTAIDKTFTLKSYIYSVFHNLLTNSVKFRKSGKHQVIRIRSEVQNDKIKISFKDSGLGIDLKLYGGKIFSLYQRFHPEIEGKGLGLFMVKTQLEVIGGKISVKSEVGIGTEFIVELPKD